jgi:peroxiredoxin
MRAPGSRDKRAIIGVMLIAVLAVALLIAACGLSGNHQAGDAGQESDEFRANADANSSRWSARSEVVATIDFRVTTLEGGEFHLADKRGRVVALYFMASWCGTCIPEVQVWSELYPAYRERGLELLMVSADPNDTPAAIERFRQAAGIDPLPWAIDRTGTVARSLEVRALDPTVLIDREGRVAYRDAAPTDLETLRGELENVL